ncbi:MAG: hypothetical protein JRI86_13990 [Deltaproteobacteria bacterium]|nr:hypothetical protein [Deltaproteobacteria bacterium]
MKRDICTRLFLIILLFPLIHGIGCGTAKSVYEKSTDAVKSVSNSVRPRGKPILRKKVLISQVMDQAGVGEAKVSQLTDSMVQILKKDGHLLVNSTTGPAPSGTNLKSPQYGVIIDPELIKKAEKMGMNVLVTSILHSFEITTKKTGIWPWRKFKREVDISMSMNAINITNGTLFLTNLEEKKIMAPVEVSEGREDKWEIDNKTLDKALSPILKDHASAILDALNNQPWTGNIILTDDKPLRISGGKDIGITKGNVFEVFGKGEAIQAAGGKKHYILGPKLGEIKAENIMQDYSTAVLLTGEQFQDGQTIRLKRK